jgi:copper resistance protein C
MILRKSLFLPAAALAGAILLPALAVAHAILIDSTPAVDGTLKPGHQTLHFHYNSKVDHHRSRLTLTGPDGKQTVLKVDPASKPDAIDAAADLVPGQYTLRWQALALDGHITRGDVPFTVAQ